jgi:hypothetical protein
VARGAGHVSNDKGWIDGSSEENGNHGGDGRSADRAESDGVSGVVRGVWARGGHGGGGGRVGDCGSAEERSNEIDELACERSAGNCAGVHGIANEVDVKRGAWN